MASLRIALAQIETNVGDFEGNSSKILNLLVETHQQADIVVFPELALTGYPLDDLASRPAFQAATQQAEKSLIERIKSLGVLLDTTVIFGSITPVESADSALDAIRFPAFNSAVVLSANDAEGKDPQAVNVQRYHKQKLASNGVFDEQRFFLAGDSPLVFQSHGKNVGLLICEDIWHLDNSALGYAGIDLDTLLVINASPFTVQKKENRNQLVTSFGKQLGVPVCYLNLVGGQDDLVFDGSSFVIDENGIEIGRAAAFTEEVLIAELFGSAGGGDKVPANPNNNDEISDIYQALVTGLRSYVRKNRFKKVTFGFSGGIDSALVAAIAADAIGGENIIGIGMPSQYSSEHSLADAKDLAERIGADYRVVAIEPLVKAYLSAMPVTGVSEENLQARIRGVLVMAVSNQEGPLVLATGNKTELAVGYSTIYGDAVGGYAPLKDVYKTTVWQLARWRNNQAIDNGEIPPIPESSITKPPSAELRPGQVDQDSLPPYPVLDALLQHYIEGLAPAQNLLNAGFDPETINRVLRLVDQAEWKRRQYPIGPKITETAFGRDRRVPITNAWRESTNSL